MFFSTELLTRRDGGFGLLWLAATLGAKSSFNKLPKRSVLNADISQLCLLISEPKEPLSLRLSSNLLVGAARVYRVKHEIFVADVNTCFASLKKAVQDMRAAGGQSLEMSNPVARPGTLDISSDPGIGRAALDLDLFAPNWDEWITRKTDQDMLVDEEDGDEYQPGGARAKGKSKKAQRGQPAPVVASPANSRAHTLKEDHLHIFANTHASSSQEGGGSLHLASLGGADTAFDRDDDLFGIAPGENADLGLDLPDWDYPTQATIALDSDQRHGVSRSFDADFPMDMDPGMPMDGDFPMFDLGDDAMGLVGGEDAGSDTRGKKRPRPEDFDKENESGDMRSQGTPVTPGRGILRGQGNAGQYADDVQIQGGQPAAPKKRTKKVHHIKDDVIELDENVMKAARDKYLEEQTRLREAEMRKRNEKEAARRVDEMIWAPPPHFCAPELLEFWHSAFKTQVDARTTGYTIDDDGFKRPLDPPRSRSRTRVGTAPSGQDDDFPPLGGDNDYQIFDGFGTGDYMPGAFDGEDRMRTPATPELARAGSKPPSITGSGVGLYDDAEYLRRDKNSGSAFSNPWDGFGGDGDGGGGASSSVIGFGGSQRGSVRALSIHDVGEERLSSRGGLAFGSPGASSNRILHGLDDNGGLPDGEDFQLDLGNGDDLGVSQSQSQSQLHTLSQSIAALEKNSHSFLEYSKAEFYGLPAGTTSINFDQIVGPETSSRRNASTGFYHCLLLATKNLIRVTQTEAFGDISIQIL